MAKKTVDLAAAVKRIVTGYARGGSFEEARGELHELSPAAMREVLALAKAPKAKGRDLLVMALADVGYPPALPAMRAWLDDKDEEAIVCPALTALDRAAGQRFGADRVWRTHGLVPELRAAIAAWWDAGVGLPSTDEEPWLTQQIEQRARDEAEVPPPSPELDREEKAELTPDLIALKQSVDKLEPKLALRLGLAAIRRALPIYERWAKDGAILVGALDATERTLDGSPEDRDREAVTTALRYAEKAARYSKAHGRYHVNAAKAAQQVAQGVLYASGMTPLQPMHYARNAIEFSGGGLAAIRAELDWQLEQVRAAL
jgi:hypothetical protein